MCHACSAAAPVILTPRSVSLGLTDYSQVDMLGVRYKAVNVGAEVPGLGRVGPAGRRAKAASSGSDSSSVCSRVDGSVLSVECSQGMRISE